jgi:hypothetical protein
MTYEIKAQKKVGRQAIGPHLAVAFEDGDRAELISKMRALYPHARISAHFAKASRDERIATYLTLYGVKAAPVIRL